MKDSHMNALHVRLSVSPCRSRTRPSAFLRIATVELLVLLTFGARVFGDEKPTSIPERTEAKAFLVKDTSGHLWGIFGMGVQDEPEPMLMLHPVGESSILITLLDEPITPRQVVLDMKVGKQYTQLGNNDKWGSFLHLTDLAGRPRLVLSTRAQKALGGDAAAWGDGPWPCMYAMSATGNPRSLFAATPKGGVCEVYDDRNRVVFRHGVGARDVRADSPTPAHVAPPSGNQVGVPPRIGNWDYNTYGAAQSQQQQRK